MRPAPMPTHEDLSQVMEYIFAPPIEILLGNERGDHGLMTAKYVAITIIYFSVVVLPQWE